MHEETYTLLTEDEIMVDFGDDGEIIDVYAYNDCNAYVLQRLGLTVADERNTLFLHAENPAKAWQRAQHYIIGVSGEEE